MFRRHHRGLLNKILGCCDVFHVTPQLPYSVEILMSVIKAAFNVSVTSLEFKTRIASGSVCTILHCHYRVLYDFFFQLKRESDKLK